MAVSARGKALSVIWLRSGAEPRAGHTTHVCFISFEAHVASSSIIWSFLWSSAHLSSGPSDMWYWYILHFSPWVRRFIYDFFMTPVLMDTHFQPFTGTMLWCMLKFQTLELSSLSTRASFSRTLKKILKWKIENIVTGPQTDSLMFLFVFRFNYAALYIGHMACSVFFCPVVKTRTSNFDLFNKKLDHPTSALQEKPRRRRRIFLFSLVLQTRLMSVPSTAN